MIIPCSTCNNKDICRYAMNNESIEKVMAATSGITCNEMLTVKVECKKYVPDCYGGGGGGGNAYPYTATLSGGGALRVNGTLEQHYRGFEE